MKKFIVDKVELMEDGFKYYAIFDKDNKDWYEEQKNFKDDTLKVMYDKDTLKVLSINRDISMLAPTMTRDVVEEIEYQEVQVNHIKTARRTKEIILHWISSKYLWGYCCM